MAGKVQMWEDVKAELEGHLDVDVISVHSNNGLEVSVVFDLVEMDWLPECFSAAEVVLRKVLAEHRQLQVPEVCNAQVFPSEVLEGMAILRVDFMLVIESPDPRLN